MSRQRHFEIGGGVSGGDVENDRGGIAATGARDFPGRGREAGLLTGNECDLPSRGREAVGERQAYPCRAPGNDDGRRQAPNSLQRRRRWHSRPPDPLIDD